MAILLLLYLVIFLFAACSLIKHSHFFHLPPSKLSPWLCSLLPKDLLFTPNLATEVIDEEEEEKLEKEKEKEGGLSSTVVENANLQSIFSTFDKDGDGFITIKELEESLRSLGITVTSIEVASMMERVDANGDGLIDLGEFSELYSTLGRSHESAGRGKDGDELDESSKEEDEDEDEDDEMDLKEAFDVFDGNRDGLITAEELGMVLNSLGLKQGARVEDLKKMIKKVDLDGDGMVNFDEFKKMMLAKGGKLF